MPSSSYDQLVDWCYGLTATVRLGHTLARRMPCHMPASLCNRRDSLYGPPVAIVALRVYTTNSSPRKILGRLSLPNTSCHSTGQHRVFCHLSRCQYDRGDWYLLVQI